MELAPKYVKTAGLFLAVLCLTASAQTADNYWPTWRGPTFTGATAKGNPPITWSESENIKWKVSVPGEGHSSPIVWGDKIFFLTAVKVDGSDAYQFNVVCLEGTTGKELWQKTAVKTTPHEGHHPTGSFASYSPVTDGQYVWASFGSRGLYCYDVEGDLKWSNPLIQMSKRRAFGEGSSPCLAGDILAVVCDHEGQSVLFGFDKVTGKEIWKTNRDEGSNWTTPVAVETNGKWHIVINGTNFVRAYDAQTGEEIWRCSGQTRNAIPTPVPGLGKIFCTSGFGGKALQAITLGRTGDLSGTDAVAWEKKDDTPYVPSPAISDNRLFVIASGAPSNNGVVSCYNAQTGEAFYAKESLPDIDSIYGSFAIVGDRVYIADRKGTTVVLKNADTFEILAVNKLDDGFNTTPAIAGDSLYLKGDNHFYCIAMP